MAIRKPKRTIFDDPRYEQFVDRYQCDPMRFAVEVCNADLSYDQQCLFQAIVPPTAKVSVVSGTGCFGKGTPMMRSDGREIAVEDVHAGDLLMGDDGKSIRKVIELKRGQEPMYRFTYQDGSSHIVNESHILCLVNTYNRNKRKSGDKCTVTVKEYLAWSKTKKRSHAIYRSPVESFGRDDELPIPPYILGLWLGDGTSCRAEITNPDIEIINEWEAYLKSVGSVIQRYEDSVSESGKVCYVLRESKKLGSGYLFKKLEELGLLNNKHIPDIYKYSSIANRKELLAGLIDTDGHFDIGSGGYDFINKVKSISEDVCWLSRSIGCHATVKRTDKRCVNNNVWGKYWRVYIGRDVGLIPVRVERKKGIGKRSKKKHLYHGISSVEPLGMGDYYGFVLDGNGMFLGHDFTVLHNTGKTFSFGIIALWHMLCHPVGSYDGKLEIGSNTYIGAPNLNQVADGIWKEMHDCQMAIEGGDVAWINEYYSITKTKVYVNGFEKQWFISQAAMQKGQSVGIAGKHRYWQMIIIDEAAGVPDEHFNVIDGTQTQGGNRTILASQGVKNVGKFYETHHNLNTLNGGSWVSLCFSSEYSPFTTTEWINNRELECGGRESIEYKIRVRGLFAEDSGSNLLTRSEIDRCFNDRPLIHEDEPYGILILSDVGLGEYRDESVAVLAKVIGYGDHNEDARRVEYYQIPICTNTKDPIDFSGELISLFGSLANATLLVDHGGVGSTVCNLIERSGIPVVKIDWGKPCFKSEYKQRFYNQRACAMVRFRDAIRSGRVKMPADIEERIKQKILLQGSRLPYHYAESGGMKYVMDKKEVMRAAGIKSPDIIDAMSFAFLEDAYYNARDVEVCESARQEKINKIKAEALKAFDDIE